MDYTKKQIEQALSRYRAGQKQEALNILESSYSELTRQDILRVEAGQYQMTGKSAVNDWANLAVDKLRRELGADNCAAVPVELALNTALSML